MSLKTEPGCASVRLLKWGRKLTFPVPANGCSGSRNARFEPEYVTSEASNRGTSRIARTGRRYAIFGALIALAALPIDGHADESWSASLAVTNNYVYRGISQTYGSGAVQVGANYQNPLGWFAGAWGSKIDPYPFGVSSKELDIYTGVNRSLGDTFSARVMFTHYTYLQDSRRVRYDHNEVAATLSYLDLIAATVSIQPDSSSYSRLGVALHRMTIGYELTGHWPLRAGFSATMGAGYYDLHDLFHVGYWAGDVGLSYAYRHFTLDLSRIFADSTAARLYEDASANHAWIVSGVLHF